MPLPASFKKILDAQSITYVCVCTPASEQALDECHPTPDPAKIVKSLLLKDTIGKMQVLLPGASLLNLSLICENLGRNFHAFEPAEEKKIANSLGVEFIPALPELTGYATLADESLFGQDTLYLESGAKGVYVKISQKSFRALSANSEKIECATAIDDFKPHITTTESDALTISQAVEKFTCLRIKQRLENTLEIPPMPGTAKNIIKLRVDPDAGVGKLAELVETDPSLAAQVVSWASSPYYAAPGKIDSVHDAVVRVLGFDLVINLALGLALGKTLNLPKDQVAGKPPYWQQAVIVAATAEAVVKLMPKENRPSIGLCYLAGLLHNFGFLILGHVFPPHLTLINRHIEANPDTSPCVIENFLLGVSREQICAWLFNAWSMPEEVITAIKYQHLPDYQDKLHLYPNLLFLSRQLIKSQQDKISAKDLIPEPILARLGICIDAAEAATAKVFNDIDNLKIMAKNLESD